ncbi:MAG: 3-oxoadipate enol-lactonase [Betaproteobacteria bacterium]
MPLARLESIDLNYRIDGDARLPWLVLSNGLGLDLTMWAPQIPALTREFRVLRYDTRGHGASSDPAHPATMEELGRDVVALLDDAGIARTHFCGFSMGGIIGQWLGIQAPHRIDRLVLAHTAALIGPVSMWNERIATVNAHGMPAISDTAMRRWFTASFIADHPVIVAELKSAMERNSPDGYVHCCAAIRDADFRSEIGAIRLPTLILSGARDPATTPADADFMEREIAGAQRVEIDAAHLSNFEKPDEFTGALLDFLGAAHAGRAATPRAPSA